MHLKSIQPFWILVLYLFTCTHFYVNGENSYLRLRNSILRIYIASDKNKLQIINEYTNKIVQKVQKVQNKVINKYYDLNLFYNTLSDEEKEFIDFIISLCY